MTKARGYTDEDLLRTSQYPQSKWSYEELIKLRTLYPDYTVSTSDLKREFPKFTLNSIQGKANDLGLPRNPPEKKVQCPECKTLNTIERGRLMCRQCNRRIVVNRKNPVCRKTRIKDLPPSTVIPLAERNQL